MTRDGKLKAVAIIVAGVSSWLLLRDEDPWL